MTSYAQFKRTLDHGAVDPSISEHVVDSQLRSAVALEPKLTRYGGAILGDEVGNGKTYIAFAVLTAALLKDDTRGAVILAPTELLEKKWETQFYEYLHKAVRDRTAVVDRDADGFWFGESTSFVAFAVNRRLAKAGEHLEELLEGHVPGCPARR